MRRLLLLIVLALGLILAGCETTGGSGVTVPRVPAWVQPIDARTFGVLEVRLEIQRLTSPFTQIDTADATFVAVSHAWLEQVIPWTWHFGKATDLDTWSAEAWDCDDISLAVGVAANIAAKRAGVRAQPLSARIFVNQSHAFGRVPAGGTHALNAFFTDRPPHYYVYEPQSRTLVPLSEYPNRGAIYRVKIGG